MEPIWAQGCNWSMHESISRPGSALPLPRLIAFALVYFLAWSTLPVLLGHSFPLDVVESLSWGKEWQWGYYKHPPFAPIVLNIFYEGLGKFGPYVLSQLCIALTLTLVWLTGKRLMDAQRAVLGAVLTMGVAYYNFPAIEFNHNIAQMPIWAALGYLFVAALQENKLRYWIGLGVVAGLGMLTKYSIAVLLLTLGLYLLGSAQYRKVLLRPGPWLAVCLMALIFAPHMLWLKASQWLPFAYASGRALSETGDPRLEALGFPLTQLAAHLPLLGVLAWAWWRSRRELLGGAVAAERRWHASSPSLLLVLTMLPGLIVMLLGVLLGLRLRDMWGSPMWAFSGLLLMALLPDVRLPSLQPKLLRGIAVWLVLVSIFMVLYMSYGAQLRNRPGRVDWPAAAIAQQAEQAWGMHSTCRLDTVAGDYWLAGLLSAYSAARPSVLIDGDPRFSPWVDVRRLKQHGALWVWQEKTQSEHPQPPEPLKSLSRDETLHTVEGAWKITWSHAPSSAPLELKWRAYVPEHCLLVK